MSKNNYFKDKHEQLVLDWIAASADTRQQFIIYSKLSPAIRNMAEIIGRRYFAIPFSRQKEYEDDAVTHCFLKMYLYVPGKTKAYSYCGTIIKNYFMDKMGIIAAKRCMTRRQIDLEYCDNFNEDERVIIETEEEITTEVVVEHLTKIKNNYIKAYKNLNLEVDRDNYQTTQRRIKVVEAMIDYAIRFDSFKPYNLYDYLRHNLGVNDFTLSNYFKEILGVNVRTTSDDTYSPKDTKFFSFLDDDFTPDEDNKSHKYSRRYSRKNKNNDYLYF